MDYKMTVPQIKEAIRDKLAHTFGVSLENATDEEYYKASVLIVRELLTKGRSEFVQNAEKTGTKQIYYLCMEFLLGRSLRNNLYNLGLEEPFRKALAEYNIKLDNLYEQERRRPGQRRLGPPGGLLYGRPGHPGLSRHGLFPAV